MGQIQWSKIVERNESVLVVDHLIRGIGRKKSKEVLGIDIGFERYLYLDKEIYWDLDDVQRVNAQLQTLIKEEGYDSLLKLAATWVRVGDNLLKESTVLGQSNNSLKNSEELYSDFDRFNELNWELSTAILLPLALEKQLTILVESLLDAKGVSKENKKKYFSSLTFPEKDSWSTKELISFYKLSALVQPYLDKENWDEPAVVKVLNNSPAINEALTDYLKKFAWIGIRWGLGETWSKVDVVRRLSQLAPEENYGEKAGELSGLAANYQKETAKICRELGLTKEETKLIKTIKEYVYIRTYRTDTFNRSAFLARPFLAEIAKRCDLTLEQLLFLTTDEITSALTKSGRENNLAERAIERQKAYGLLFENNSISVVEGNAINEMRSRLGISEGSVAVDQEIHGTVAFPGQVTGRVKVVVHIKYGGKMKPGDILVTAMTTPDFVPLMQMASAIITDEGGILCHAAIVSREMKKPCIIGTKIATKVLKDGDLVEVDANNGTVKKLR